MHIYNPITNSKKNLLTINGFEAGLIMAHSDIQLVFYTMLKIVVRIMILFILTMSISFANEPSLKQMIGRKLLLSLPGISINDSTMMQAQQWISQGQISGLILFEYNIRSRNQVHSLLKNLRTGSPFQPIFAIDEEGGLVKRLKSKKRFTSLPSAKWMALNTTPKKAQSYYKKHSHELQTLGFNVNLAPVVDMNINPESPAIGKVKRSYSSKADIVINYAGQMVQASLTSHIIPTLKHFPGHGSAQSDSHLGVTDISKTWTQKELTPFKYFIEKNIPMIVLIGHLFNENIDELYPASLSKKTIKGLLREELGYGGVVLSDDLQMGALTEEYAMEDIIILAIQAGNDLLQFSDPLSLRPDFPQWFSKVVLKAINNGRIRRSDIETSYRRVEELLVQVN